MRIVIAGGPRCGKTTFAATLEGECRHTDDLIATNEWSKASEEVAHWLSEPGPWVIEGVAMGRALRKFMVASPEKPCDRVVWMIEPKVPLTPGQCTMLKGCETVWRKILPELRARGVEIR